MSCLERNVYGKQTAAGPEHPSPPATSTPPLFASSTHAPCLKCLCTLPPLCSVRLSSSHPLVPVSCRPTPSPFTPPRLQRRHRPAAAASNPTHRYLLKCILPCTHLLTSKPPFPLPAQCLNPAVCRGAPSCGFDALINCLCPCLFPAAAPRLWLLFFPVLLANGAVM